MAHSSLDHPSANVSLSHGSSRDYEIDCNSPKRDVMGFMTNTQGFAINTEKPEACRSNRKWLKGRSRSFSAPCERYSHDWDQTCGSINVTVDRDAPTTRPRTAEIDAVPRLEIFIPNYKLGNPYFGQRGTPILRTSVCTRFFALEDMRSNSLSKTEYDRLFTHPNHFMLDHRHSEASYGPRIEMQPNETPELQSNGGAVPNIIGIRRSEERATISPIRSSIVPIAPEVFDNIAANPNDARVVRYSVTGDMVAATPSRLVEHITSPSFLDYELLSDFFLTYRSFLTAVNLVSYLIARLRWAISCRNDVGRIVRVRTFVALRHWILNYFADDFIPDFSLRLQFCQSVNALSSELRKINHDLKSDLKIIGELKKCWHRTCMLYWDESSDQLNNSPSDDITPGTHLSLKVAADKLVRHSLAREMTSSKLMTQDEVRLTRRESSACSHLPDIIDSRELSSEPADAAPQISETLPLSPMSEQSVQAASCSIPFSAVPKKIIADNRSPQHDDGTGGLSSIASQDRFPMSTITTNAANENIKFCHKGKRSISFCHALQDTGAPMTQSKNYTSSTQASAKLKNSVDFVRGSLIRGRIFAPGEPFIDIVPQRSMAACSQINVVISQTQDGLNSLNGNMIDQSSNDNDDVAVTLSTAVSSNPGVKRILGSVRRALSGRQSTDKVYTSRMKSQTLKATAYPAFNAPQLLNHVQKTGSGDFLNSDESRFYSRRDFNSNTKNKKQNESKQDPVDAYKQRRVDFLAATVLAEYRETIQTNVKDENRKGEAKMQEKVSRPSNSRTYRTSNENYWPNNLGPDSAAVAANYRRTFEVMTSELDVDNRPITAANTTSPHSIPCVPCKIQVQQTSTADNMLSVERQECLLQQVRNDAPSPALQKHQHNGSPNWNGIENTDDQLTMVYVNGHDEDKSINSHENFCKQQIREGGRLPKTFIGISHSPSAQTTKSPSLNYSNSTKYQKAASSSLWKYVPHESGGATSSVHAQRRSSGRGNAATVLIDDHTNFPRASSLVPSLSSITSLSRCPHKQKLPPLRKFRRRPGGDLRAFGNVHELERPYSTGSLSNPSHSVTNSISFRPIDDAFLDGFRFTDDAKSRSRELQRISFNATTRKAGTTRRPYSLVQTHSSQPNLRPSFEAEVAKLAALPDEEGDDGGIEAALLKLEGKYESSFKQDVADSYKGLLHRTISQSSLPVNASTSPLRVVNVLEKLKKSSQRGGFHATDHHDGSGDSTKSVTSNKSNCSTRSLPLDIPSVNELFKSRDVGNQSCTNSDNSYSSIPLLQRGLSRQNGSEERNLVRDFPSGKIQAAVRTEGFTNWSRDTKSALSISRNKIFGDKDETKFEASETKNVCNENSAETCSFARDSFLLNSDQSLTDRASDISTGELIISTVDGSKKMESFYGAEVVNNVITYGVDSRQIRDENRLNSGRIPTSPSPSCFIEGHDATLTTLPLRKQHNHLPIVAKSSSLSNQLSCSSFATSDPGGINISKYRRESSTSISPLPHMYMPSAAEALKHIPFILAFDSETIAQQFTIVEKDALDEIDWKELIELRWDQSAKDVRNWLCYLNNEKKDSARCRLPKKSEQSCGIDIAFARFNLMVKWAISECVLTEDIKERALVLVKYIHIAAHAKRLQNYMTMFQITIALLSSDCSRLRSTWELVPQAERETLQNLEKLVQPLGNFSNLRHELETVALDYGCIPFIG